MSDNFETLENFIARNRITMVCERADVNPDFGNDGRDMDHWRVVLRLKAKTQTRSFSTFFSMYRGYNGATPDADTVLDCLASDASAVENTSGFEDWADEVGYSTDSRTAERIYKALQRNAKRLRAFLGEAEYRKLISHQVESL